MKNITQTTIKSAIIGLGVIIIGIIIVLSQNTITVDKQSKESQTMTIGAVLPLTGDFAFVGESIQKGALVAVQELSEKGVVVELKIEDDAMNAKQTVSATQKLLNANVDGIFIAAAQQSKPIGGLFSESKTPLLVTWDATEYIATLGDSVFSTGFSTESAGREMAQYAIAHGINTWTIINQKDEWSELIASSAHSEFTKHGDKVTFTDSVSLETHDFKTQILKAMQSKSQAIFIPFIPNYIAPFLKQARDMGYTGLIMTADSITPSEIQLAGTYAEGLVYTNVWSNTNQHFITQYQQMYGTEPEDAVFTGFGYDAVMTYYRAHQIAQQKNIDMVSAMKQVQINRANGNIDFTQGNTSAKIEKMYKVIDGKSLETN